MSLTILMTLSEGNYGRRLGSEGLKWFVENFWKFQVMEDFDSSLMRKVLNC